MGVRVEVSRSKRVAIGLIVVLVITAIIPRESADDSYSPIDLEPMEGEKEPQIPMTVTDDSSLLRFSSYLGGSGDEEYSTSDIDAAGNIYIAGTTESRDFPLVNPLDASFEGRGSEGFLTKIDPNGTIIYSTYIGGNDGDGIRDIFVDDDGFVYLTGGTASEDFPTVNAFDSTQNNGDCFVCKINQAGTAFVYSTLIGGLWSDSGKSIWVNQQGEAYVAGETASYNFPTRTPIDGSLDGFQDCFVSKLSKSGNTLLYSTLLGGGESEDAHGIVGDTEGAIYVTGTTWSYDFPVQNGIDHTFSDDWDGFVCKINPSGASLNFSTFLGGNSVESTMGIDVDSLGRSYVIGRTTSTDFPTLRALDGSYSGNVDGFLTVFNPEGSLNYSTYFGNSRSEWPLDVCVNGIGSVYVCGSSNSLPEMTRNSYDSIFNGGVDGFVFRMNIDCEKVILGSYLGGSRSDEATSVSVDCNNTMYVSGWTGSDNFPMKNPVDSTYNPGGNNGYDAFVSVIADSSDWDLDGIPDKEEEALGTDSFNPDTDFDLLGDYLEVYQLGTNPLSNCTFGNGTLDGDLDHDGDLLTNVEELYEYHTDLLNWDSDSDLLADGFEVYTVGSLPTEFDSDFDLLSDWTEYMIYNTDCLSPDSELDSMDDYYEVHNGLDPLADDANEDEDGDLLTNHQEYIIGTSANNSDSDSDFMPDAWEYNNGLNPRYDDSFLDHDDDQLSNLAEYQNGCDPTNRDCDQDSLDDGLEVLVLHTNPLSNDTENDAMPDSWEVEFGLNPLFDDSSQDLDADGLSNLEEYQLGTRPNLADTDRDSYLDGWEVRNGFDPTDSNVRLAQAIYANLPLLLAGIGIELITIPVLYRRVRQKRMKASKEEQKYQDRVSKEIKELLGDVDDSSDSDD